VFRCAGTWMAKQFPYRRVSPCKPAHAQCRCGNNPAWPLVICGRGSLAPPRPPGVAMPVSSRLQQIEDESQGPAKRNRKPSNLPSRWRSRETRRAHHGSRCRRWRRVREWLSRATKSRLPQAARGQRRGLAAGCPASHWRRCSKQVGIGRTAQQG